LNDNLSRLVRLQEVEFEIQALRRRRDDELPSRSAEYEAAFEQKIADIGADRLRHEELVALRRELLQQKEDLEARLRQSNERLAHVTNQREYSAALNEIDHTRQELQKVEEQLVACEEEIEQLAGPAAEADERIAEERRKMDEALAEIAREREEVVARLGELEQVRDEIVRELPGDWYRRFERIKQARGGVAIARIVPGGSGQACGECHVRLRPQLVALARRGEGLVFCESCKRILYWVAEEADPAPGAAPGAGSAAGGEAPATGSGTGGDAPPPEGSGSPGAGSAAAPPGGPAPAGS